MMTENEQLTQDIAELAQHHLANATDDGYAPDNARAWLVAKRIELLAFEREQPGYTARALDGLHARSTGRRITRCSERRGSHAFSHVYDPHGTDPTPSWWNEAEAKALYQEEQMTKRKRPTPGVHVPPEDPITMARAVLRMIQKDPSYPDQTERIREAAYRVTSAYRLIGTERDELERQLVSEDEKLRTVGAEV